MYIRSAEGAELVWYTQPLDVNGGDSATISMSGTTTASNVGVAAAIAMQRLGMSRSEGSQPARTDAA